jgi:hypothetical protein
LTSVTRLVGPADDPTTPQHECDRCGTVYYGRGAALQCCSGVLPDGGGDENPHGPNPVAEEELLQDITRVADDLDEVPRVEDYNSHGEYHYSTVKRRFDTCAGALPPAGAIDDQYKISDSETVKACPECEAARVGLSQTGSGRRGEQEGAGLRGSAASGGMTPSPQRPPIPIQTPAGSGTHRGQGPLPREGVRIAVFVGARHPRE